MNCLIVEIVFYCLFIYFAISTFSAELLNGFLQSFLCVFGWASLKETEGNAMPFALFYYSYAILLSLLGNIMFVLSLVIYGPVCRRAYTQVTQQKAKESETSGSSLPTHQCQKQVIYCTGRRLVHICGFTRYDLYALLVLLFISIQVLSQSLVGIDDFKDVEGMVFKKTIENTRINASEDHSCGQFCDDLTGVQALKSIHEFQQTYQCCGWSDPKDWFTCENNYSLPKSCCYDLSQNCSLDHKLHFTTPCHEFELPVRGIIDPTRYSDHCLGLYPIYKLLALICYQFSFKKLFDGSALVLKVNLFFPSNIRLI